MTNAITTTAVKDLLKETLGAVAYDYDNLVKSGTDGMKAYLKDANLPEKQKAELYSNFMGQVITTSIQASIMLAGDIAKANAEFDFRSNEKLKSVEELNILKEQLKQELYKTLTIMPKEYEGLVQDVLMKQATIVTESKKQLQTIADTARLSAQKLLLDAETDGETKKNAVNGVIDRQTELYNQQALSFKGHNLSKGADSFIYDSNFSASWNSTILAPIIFRGNNYYGQAAQEALANLRILVYNSNPALALTRTNFYDWNNFTMPTMNISYIIFD